MMMMMIDIEGELATVHDAHDRPSIEASWILPAHI